MACDALAKIDALTPADSAVEPRLRPFLACTAGLCAILAAAGWTLARRFGFEVGIAVPVTAAFCWQAALYCGAVSGAARQVVRTNFAPVRLAALLVAVSVAPYLIYTVPTGRSSLWSASRLALLCSCVAFPYALFPTTRRSFRWQDALVSCALAYPMISGLSTLFREVYQGFAPPAHRLDALGKLMLIPLGMYAFLELRRLQGTGFRLVPTRRDWKVGLESSGYSLPWVVAVGVSTGYLQWDPPLVTPVRDVGEALAKLVGIYCTTALAEEFLLRGVVQNLVAASTGRPRLAQGLSALVFGAVHLGRGAFPNLPYAATAAVLGWFCGRAYALAGSVTAAMVAHALAVAGQELFFR